MKGNEKTGSLSAGGVRVDKAPGAIDRSEMHRRLANAVAAGERSRMLTAAEKRSVLRARAARLAREPESDGADTRHLEVVEFVLARERYGVESSYVLEVYPLKDFTPLPCTPAFVLGVINVRGRLLSVIDVKKFFELPDKGLTDLNKVIIVHAGDMALGILADAVIGIRSIPLQEIQPTLPTLAGIRADYLRGVTKERLVLLDVERILSDPKLVVNEQVEG